MMTIDDLISHKRVFKSEEGEDFFRDIAAFSIVVNTKIGSHEASGKGFPMHSLQAMFRSFDYIVAAYSIEQGDSSRSSEDEVIDNLSYAHAMLVLAYYHASLGVAAFYADLYIERMGEYAKAELKGYAGVNEIYDALMEARRRFSEADENLRASTIIDTESIFSLQAVHLMNLSLDKRRKIIDAIDDYTDANKELYIAGCNALPLFEEHRSRHDRFTEGVDRFLGCFDTIFSIIDVITAIIKLI